MLRALSQLSLTPLRRYGLQSVLAITGVAIGVANIIMLINITDLARHQTIGLINELGANLIIVMPFLDTQNGAMAQLSSNFSPNHLPGTAVETVRAVPEIRAVTAAMLMPGHVGLGETHVSTTVQGVTAEFAELRGHAPARGRFITREDEDSRARVVCLGDTVTKRLFKGSGTEPLGATVEIRGEPFEVIAVMEHKGMVGFEDVDNRVYIPLATAQQLYEFDGVHGMFAAYREGIDEATAMAAVKQAMATLAEPGEDPEESFSVINIKEATELMDNTLGIFRKVLLGISSIAMLVAGIGIMNVMLIQVLQRRHEIGIRRSVGATSGGILLQFLSESVVQSLIGAVFGIALGIAGVYAYCAYSKWTVYIGPLTVLLGALYSIGIGVVFGSYPAWRAAKLDPVKSLRMEF